MTGALLVVLIGPLSRNMALEYVRFNTLGLLTAMMIIVSVTKKTGFFQYISFKLVKIADGRPIRILIFFSIVTAISSALMDNVTTVVMVVPIVLTVCHSLELTPLPFLVTEIISSNIGGTATLIGDPPNIMIGTANNLNFVQFIYNLGPIILIIYILTLLLIYLIYRHQLEVDRKNIKDKLERLNSKAEIEDKKLAYKSLCILGLTIIGFVLHKVIGIHTVTVAIIGALTLLLVSGVNVREIFDDVEWATIFFFGGLFILVGALEEVGVLNFMANKIIELTNGKLGPTSSLFLWAAGLSSGFIDNIPFVATAIPIIKKITHGNQTYLWWSLSLGACLGGNMTLIGASANVIIAGIAEDNGEKIKFIDYLRVGAPLTIMTLIISQLYIYVRYIL